MWKSGIKVRDGGRDVICSYEDYLRGNLWSSLRDNLIYELWPFPKIFTYALPFVLSNVLQYIVKVTRFCATLI